MALVDLKKAIERQSPLFSYLVVWKLGIDEWLVRAVEVMYMDVVSKVKVGNGYSNEFE